MVMIEARQIVDGALLSDASIFPYKKGLRMSLAQTGSERVDWVSSVTLACNHIYLPARYRMYNGDKYPRGYVYMWTRGCPELEQLYRRWYPKGSKIVPEDIILTGVTTANWFMGDGSSTFSTGWGVAKFSTQGFRNDDMDMLILKLAGLGITASRDKCGNYWAIYVTDSGSVNVLMDLIEPFMLPSYKYKVKRPSW